MTRSRSRAIALTAMSLVAMALPSGAVAAGSPVASTRVARLATLVPPGSTALGQLADPTPLTFEVVLEPSHRAELQQLLADQRDPSSPLYQHYLEPGEFARDFGPTSDQISGVTSWLHSRGFDDVSVDGSAVHVRTTAGAAGDGLGVAMERYRTPNRHESFFARDAPLVPETVAPNVSAILGLTDAPAALPRLDASPGAAPRASAGAAPHADGLTPCSAATSAAGGQFYTPDQVGSLYGVGSLLTNGQNGTGQSIALVELAPHLSADTNAFKSCFGLTNTVTAIKVDGGAPTDPGGSLEANIDVEEAAVQSPHSTILSYEGPNTATGERDVYTKIVNDDLAKSVSTSWGLCEAFSSSTIMNQLDALFAQAAAQGQTVVAASGDSGSEDCFAGGQAGGSSSLAVDSPADDPNVTGVGGTFLLGAGDETVWNDCDGESTFTQCENDLSPNSGGAGGGGLSAHFTRPAWQPAPAAGTCSLSSCRAVPDVSANAGVGEVFRSNGGWGAVGGTSIAAPKIAAIVADVNTACVAPVGELAPKLVTIAGQTDGYTVSLNDITSGNNDLARVHANSFTATTGTDLATGVGAPVAPGWSCPQISDLSAQNAAVGTSVTLTGFGLSDATFKFGNTSAVVTAQDATSATVTVPAGTGVVTVTGTNTMGTGTQTIDFAYPGFSTTTTTTSTSTTTTSTSTTTTVPPTTTTTTVPPPPPPKPDPPNTHAYRMVASDGGIFSFGGAKFFGSTGAIHLNRPIVGMATDRATGGYWFVASDGGIFGFNAPFFGSAGGAALDAPVVGMASTPNGKGYWLVTAAGSVFAFGNAPNFGSATRPHAPIAGIAPSADGKGYWVAGRDGSIYAFGDAHNFGSMFGTPLKQPIVGISADTSTGGYWLVATDGGIFGFDAPFFGSTGAIRLNQPIVGIAPTSNGKGYWMVASDGGIFSFGNATFAGSMGGSKLNQPMVGMAGAR